MIEYRFAKPVKINGSSEAVFLLRAEGDLFIPFDPANTDYAAYLKWVEAGNAPLPAEQPE